MGSVLSYSGISTKIRAMSSHLVTDEQLQEIVRFSDVPQVAAYLKKTPEYAKPWSDLDENNLHRGEIEKLLKKSIFGNFSRIYNFANKEQRKFLALYSKRYEIRVLKEIMTNLFDHRSTDPVDMSPYRDFYLTTEWLLIFIILIRSGVSAKSYSRETIWTRSPRLMVRSLIC